MKRCVDIFNIIKESTEKIKGVMLWGKRVYH